MRKSAAEYIRHLEMRIARLERTAAYRLEQKGPDGALTILARNAMQERDLFGLHSVPDELVVSRRYPFQLMILNEDGLIEWYEREMEYRITAKGRDRLLDLYGSIRNL